ncbi:CaiB/BaiF CoA transferase family protein [Natronorubrum texcoconense]|uniref:Crotonobetainyl-CoA:carnitine CoA-transferase CaiB n=1 Tax=Natronorubrum texcoconense TaxID=1095776 RepID=A0A1G9D4H9_9EURY|nr:CaiB/BaiF CoA-transferase family protein [Natronorubrum texcoconense]SDK58787.1 Crotonobetainyl-CoA:carnitine CoA-transferase CaiB [Natronorubrum texcoconense]
MDGQSMTDENKILDGITVLDMSTFVTGGFCSSMLANQGAEVIKIEQPGYGDAIRHSGPPFIEGESPYYWTVNYGKRSVELDLKNDEALEALYDLVAEADVFIQNFRPGVAERLNVDYDTLTEHNETLVYLAVSAFGQTGPWRERSGYDLLIQGLSGIMDVTGEEGRQPVKVGLPMTDLITAMWAAFGTMTALYNRELTGEGEYIDLGMLEATLPWLTKQAGRAFADETPERMGTKDPVLAPYQTFETEDSYINVCVLNEKLWADLCEAIDRPELIDDDRFDTNADRVDHLEELEAEIEATLTEKTTDEWVEIIADEGGVPAGPVYSVEEALNNPQIEARGTMTELDHPEIGTIPVVEHPLKFEHADSGFEVPPPLLGEHNRVVFRELGYSEAELDELAAAGVFGDQETAD